MWLFLNNAFLSIVAPNPNTDAAFEDMLLVRARLPGDIKAVFSGVKVLEDKERKRDYRFRALIPRKQVVEVLADKVKTIDYQNFKNSTGPAQHWRHQLYMRVWSVMHSEQEKQRPLPKQRKSKPGQKPVGEAYGTLDNTHWDHTAKVWRRDDF